MLSVSRVPRPGWALWGWFCGAQRFLCPECMGRDGGEALPSAQAPSKAAQCPHSTPGTVSE